MTWSFGLQSTYIPTDWAHGGPIIERERISTNPAEGADDEGQPGWKGWVSFPNEPSAVGPMYGITILIAAMRAYVASKFGDEGRIAVTLRTPETLHATPGARYTRAR